MTRAPFAAIAPLALAAWASPAVASLTPGEAEEIRHDVAVVQAPSRVRALVARPDLTSSEAGAAMSAAMVTSPLDASHVVYLRELVFGAASSPSRPVVAAAVVRGVLARVDALLAQHPSDLDRSRAALAEIAAGYGLVEEVVASDERDNVTSSARADCARALKEHVAHNPAVLRPDAPVGVGVAVARAQAAIALFDALPATPLRRVDAADALGLDGARRAVLVETGVLVLDSGGTPAAAASIRPPLDRLPGARAAVEAIVIGDEHASLRGRDGLVLALPQPTANPAEDSPGAPETATPPAAATTLAAARALASIEVDRALERRPSLRQRVEQDGQSPGAVARLAAMLVIDAPRTLDVMVANWLDGKHETASWLADAIGALAVFAPTPATAEGVTLMLGGSAAGNEIANATRVSLDRLGAASAFRLAGHSWRIGRAPDGQIESLRRDGAAVARTLPGTEATLSVGPSWRGAGLVFARLSGSPRAALAAGPRIRLLGSGPNDAIATPAPGDDVAVDTDLRVDGAPAGIAVRAVPTAIGFKGISLIVRPGPTQQAILLISDGVGAETAAGPAVTLAKTPTQRVHLTVKGRSVEATLGSTKLVASISDDFAHGDLALRAFSGATLEATGWHVTKP